MKLILGGYVCSPLDGMLEVSNTIKLMLFILALIVL